MKKQAEPGLHLSTRRTCKAVFLEEMELVVPMCELVALIAAEPPRVSWRPVGLSQAAVAA
jgi:IS5 family transposase